jgi:eukaryotic translation initiation factor 2C
MPAVSTNSWNLSPQTPNHRKLEVFLGRVRVRRSHLDNSPPKTIIGLARGDDGRRIGQRHLAHPPEVLHHGAGARQVKFWLEEGEIAGRYITVYDFFLQSKYRFYNIPLFPTRLLTVPKEYNRTLDKPKHPVVNVGTRDNPIYLPPEVCMVIPGQHAKAQLNPSQTQKMIQFAVRKPVHNAASIVDEGLKTVGLIPGINPRLVSLPALHLDR